MNIAVVGTGFVGVVTAAVFAKFGQNVTGLDIDETKIASLNQGTVPFYEPGLDELLKSGISTGNLHFTTSYHEAISSADVAIVAVGTPSSPEGKADLTFVHAAVEQLAVHIKQDAVIVIKSTVPPGILPQLRARVEQLTNHIFHLASMPEFLREGSAVTDTLHPDRIVIGAESETAAGLLTELHKTFNAPIIVTSPASAQLGKYAANSYLALRIGFINQIADLAEKVGADVQEVITIIGADKRIGSHYWYPGLGYGGSCYPKDVRELSYTTRQLGMGENLFVKLNELNEERPEHIFKRWTEFVGGWTGKKIAVLGLSFKPHTNDTREAPSLWLVPKLVAAGAVVVGYDPEAASVFESELKKLSAYADSAAYSTAQSVTEATEKADVIIALVEWPEITQHSFGSTQRRNNQTENDNQIPAFIDARNQFSPELVKRWGYRYIGIGRPSDTVD